MPSRAPIRFVLTLLLVLFAGVASAADREEKSQSPNVLIVLTDDQGWGDLSHSGNTNLSTPHIDSLATDGASFDRFYVCPVCSPTRAEFLTGRYHTRGGVYSTSAGGERLDLDEVTIADAFQQAGYKTACFGKWHNGMQYPYHPRGRGFDEYYGFASGHWGHYYSPMLEHNGALTRGDGFVVDDFTNRAIDFMSSSREEGKPFFVYLPLNTPHAPMQVPDRFWDKFKNHSLGLRSPKGSDKGLGHTRAAYAMCENIDWNVGRLLQTLEQLNLEEETIVVFFHDNGPNGSRWNGGMKGRKGSTDEGGVRSPLFLRWTGSVKPGTTVKPISSAMDLYPTLAKLCGVPVASEKKLDGVDMSGYLLGTRTRIPERTIFSHWRGKVSARTQQYRLDHTGKLYDMLKDPGQAKDISREEPELAGKLRSAVDSFRADVVSELPKQDTRPFVICAPDFEWTQVPARDGTAVGGIIRSNKYPNCSYFLNWTQESDAITWPVHVQAAGVYEVTVYYCCESDDVGSTITLSVGDRTLTKKLTEPNTSPLIGAEQDRVPRPESYVKNFAPWSMGRIRLDEGAATMKLSASDIPGDEVMEFRLLMLRRVGE